MLHLDTVVSKLNGACGQALRDNMLMFSRFKC